MSNDSKRLCDVFKRLKNFRQVGCGRKHKGGLWQKKRVIGACVLYEGEPQGGPQNPDCGGLWGRIKHTERDPPPCHLTHQTPGVSSGGGRASASQRRQRCRKPGGHVVKFQLHCLVMEEARRVNWPSSSSSRPSSLCCAINAGLRAVGPA